MRMDKASAASRRDRSDVAVDWGLLRGLDQVGGLNGELTVSGALDVRLRRRESLVETSTFFRPREIAANYCMQFVAPMPCNHLALTAGGMGGRDFYIASRCFIRRILC